MSRMIVLLSTAVVLFSLAAGASWYFQPAQTSEEEPAKAVEERPAKKDKGKTLPAASEPLPNRVTPRPPVTPETERLAKMASSLVQQQDALKHRESQLAVREGQLNLVHDEIKKEHKKLAAVRKEIDATLAAVEEKLALLEARASLADKKHKEADARMDEVNQKIVAMKPNEAKNVKQVAAIYEKMEPEAGAANVQQLVEKGEMDFAVAILAAMRERQSAAIFGELTKLDSGTAAQIFSRIRHLKGSEVSLK
jgi:flagellar motility protein MotE (MotC chaperone)